MKPLPVGQFHYPPGAPDMSREGKARRLWALREAVRYRNPETGRRHHCHQREYRAGWIASMRAYRQALRQS